MAEFGNIVRTSLDLIGENRLQLLLDAVKDYAIYLLDHEGRVASWNTGAQRFKGYDAEEIIGQHFSRFYTEEDRARGLPEYALRQAAEHGIFEAEGWRLRKDGTRFWASVVIDPVLDNQGALIGFAKVTRDITHKKNAERALHESEQRFRLLVEGVKDYAIYMLDPQGNVTNWNAGAQAIKGYTADEIVGQHFSRFYTEEDQRNGEPQRALATARADKYQVESWRVRKDGTRFWAGVLIDPIFDETGTLLGYAKVTRDLTERWHTERELERAREAVMQAQKMEAVGRLTGGVAHDFNNLLTIIQSAADMLGIPDITAEKRERYLDAIVQTAAKAATLTGQLLAFARRQPLKPEVFDIGARLEAMRQIIETSVGSRIKVSIDADAASPVNADRNQFETAILNLVINARDAMPDGGAISITAQSIQGIPAVRGHSAVSGGFSAVHVRDDGSGISNEVLSRIFEPFFTTKAVDKGTGLGLSQVHGFVKQSGGEIDVSSEIGKGTTFTLYLPAATSKPVTNGAAAVRSPTGNEVGCKSILLVEDNEAVGQFARTLFEELGQVVDWAPNAEAALALIEAAPNKFDLVFTDVVMPGMSGIELAILIRSRWPDVPVILTSGYSHVLAEQGSHGFELLRKPYSLSGLVRILGTTTA